VLGRKRQSNHRIDERGFCRLVTPGTPGVQFEVRNQIANVPGASVPQPYGGKYRQIQIYVDPVKLEAHQLSVMNVVRSVDESNLILHADDARIGPKDYNVCRALHLNTKNTGLRALYCTER